MMERESSKANQRTSKLSSRSDISEKDNRKSTDIPNLDAALSLTSTFKNEDLMNELKFKFSSTNASENRSERNLANEFKHDSQYVSSADEGMTMRQSQERIKGISSEAKTCLNTARKLGINCKENGLFTPCKEKLKKQKKNISTFSDNDSPCKMYSSSLIDLESNCTTDSNIRHSHSYPNDNQRTIFFYGSWSSSTSPFTLDELKSDDRKTVIRIAGERSVIEAIERVACGNQEVFTFKDSVIHFMPYETKFSDSTSSNFDCKFESDSSLPTEIPFSRVLSKENEVKENVVKRPVEKYEVKQNVVERLIEKYEVKENVVKRLIEKYEAKSEIKSKPFEYKYVTSFSQSVTVALIMTNSSTQTEKPTSDLVRHPKLQEGNRVKELVGKYEGILALNETNECIRNPSFIARSKKTSW